MVVFVFNYLLVGFLKYKIKFMNSTFFLNSPLEQFDILPLINFHFGNFDFSITNATIILFVIFFLFSAYFLASIKQTDSTLYLVPHRWQVIVEILYKIILSLVTTNVDKPRGQLFFPLFLCILLLNLAHKYDF